MNVLVIHIGPEEGDASRKRYTYWRQRSTAVNAHQEPIDVNDEEIESFSRVAEEMGCDSEFEVNSDGSIITDQEALDWLVIGTIYEVVGGQPDQLLIIPEN